MEELMGGKLSVGLREDMKRHAARAGQTVEEFLTKQKAKDEEALAKGETLQGPTAAEFDLYISILNRQRQLENIGNMLFNLTVGWLPGKQWKKHRGKNELPINHARMIDDLIYVHGHEVFSISRAGPAPSDVLALTVVCRCRN